MHCQIDQLARMMQSNTTTKGRGDYNQISTQSSHGGVRFTIEDEEDVDNEYTDDDGDIESEEDIEKVEDEVVYGQGHGSHRPGYHLTALKDEKHHHGHKVSQLEIVKDGELAGDDDEMEEISFDNGRIYHVNDNVSSSTTGDIELGSMKKKKKRGNKKPQGSGNSGIPGNETGSKMGNIDDPSKKSFSKRDRVPDFSNPANFWTIITFSWMQDLLEIGKQKPLELSDLYYLSHSDSAEGIYKRFKINWIQQMQEFFLLHDKITKHERPSLVKTFFYTFGKPFAAAAVLKLIHDSALFMGPVLLSKLVQFLDDPSQPMTTGLKYVAYLFLTNLLMSLCLRQYFW